MCIDFVFVVVVDDDDIFDVGCSGVPRIIDCNFS